MMNWVIRGPEVARLRAQGQGDVGEEAREWPYESGKKAHGSLRLVLLPTRQHPPETDTNQYGGQYDLSHSCERAFVLGDSSVCIIGS